MKLITRYHKIAIQQCIHIYIYIIHINAYIYTHTQDTFSAFHPGSDIQRRTGCVEMKRSPKVRNAHVILQQEARCTTALDSLQAFLGENPLAPRRLHNVLWQSQIALDLSETTVCPVVLFSALLHGKRIRICQKGARTAQSSSQF